jgi:hypothetical protein
MPDSAQATILSAAPGIRIEGAAADLTARR